MHKLTLIVPIHKLSEEDFEFLENTVTSINSQTSKEFKVTFVVSTDISTEFKERLLGLVDDSIEASIVVNEGNTNYQAQINFFVADHLDTAHFAVLQYDDIILDNYIMNAIKYIDAYPSHSVFVPIIFEVDNKNNFIGFSNEAVWSIGHMQTFGEFDLANTKKHHFYNYNICGAIINGVNFLDAGGFKPSLKKFNDYEFILRMLELGNNIQVIPKICYKHINGRTGSIFDSLKDMPRDEEKFWYELAKKEYHFEYDRDIKYAEK